jgi:hypothetical protein
METIKEAIDNYQSKTDLNQMYWFLSEYSNISEKRKNEINKEYIRLLEDEIFPEVAEEIESFVNNLYQLYEEGLLPELSRKTDAIKVDPDFSCRYWE